jgi:hypothetical protein
LKGRAKDREIHATAITEAIPRPRGDAHHGMVMAARSKTDVRSTPQV